MEQHEPKPTVEIICMACFKNGDRTRGLRVLESARKVDPNTPEAQMAEAVKNAPK
jgi:hypothetical protein